MDYVAGPGSRKGVGAVQISSHIQLCEAPAKSLLGHTECKDSSYLTSFATCVSWLDLEIKGQFLLLLIPNGILEGFRNSTLGRFAIAERQRIHG